MALGDAHLPVFFRDFGDPVSCGGVSVSSTGEPIKAIVENIGADAVFDQVRVSDATIRAELPWSAFAQGVLAEGVEFHVLGGRNAGRYKIRSVEPVDDGATVQVTLRKL